MTILFVYKSSIDSLRSIFNSCRSLYFIVFYISLSSILILFFFCFQAEDGIRDKVVTGVQTCALPIFRGGRQRSRVLQRLLVGVSDDDQSVQALEHLVRGGMVVWVVPEEPRAGDRELVEEGAAG